MLINLSVQEVRFVTEVLKLVISHPELNQDDLDMIQTITFKLLNQLIASKIDKQL